MHVHDRGSLLDPQNGIHQVIAIWKGQKRQKRNYTPFLAFKDEKVLSHFFLKPVDIHEPLAHSQVLFTVVEFPQVFLFAHLLKSGADLLAIFELMADKFTLA